jgi:ribonuclease HII
MSPNRYPTLFHEKRALSKGYELIVGVDESGRGPLAGPVVAAAVIVNKHRFKNKIDDSKRLTARGRLSAYEEIRQNCIYNIAVIDTVIIDHINIYNAARLAMEKAVIGLSIKPDYVLVDGKMKLSLPCEGRTIINGDRYCFSIACASIIAKVWRDRIMQRFHELYPKYGFISHKGYGTVKHFKMLNRYGPSPIHRMSFRLTERQRTEGNLTSEF